MIILQFDNEVILFRNYAQLKKYLVNEGYTDIKMYPDEGFVFMDINEHRRVAGRVLDITKNLAK